MFIPMIRAAAPLFLLSLPIPAAAEARAPITAEDLMSHIEILASDEFEGRKPGTEGETLTTSYIVDRLRSAGIEPAGTNGSWFQPVELVERSPVSKKLLWTANGREIAVDPGKFSLIGKDELNRIDNAPVLFVGHGARIPDRGIDQLAGADLRGAVVLFLLQGPSIPGFPSVADRRRALIEAGAAAVIGVIDSAHWDTVKETLAGRTTVQLGIEPVAAMTGMIPLDEVQNLFRSAGAPEGVLDESTEPGFQAVNLPLRASLEATSRVDRHASNNVVGRLRGSGGTDESVLFLSHWDHEGICRPEGAVDRICNGAIDNASGIASMIEIADRLARGPKPVRDILFLATTAEELGLLGAEYFATHPVVPARSIVAAINMDSVAVHPEGLPVAMIGRGISPALDQVVDSTAEAMGREVDRDEEANIMIQRQDGWKLNQAGIPTVMVGGSFSDMSILGAFLEGSYHKPNDEVSDSLVLGGAVEDANLMVKLAFRLADPQVYQGGQD